MHHKPNVKLKLIAYAISFIILLPLFYLLIRALEADSSKLIEIVFNKNNLTLLSNSLSLVAGVLIMVTCIALPLAWIVTRTTIANKRLLTLLCIAPLAIPGYVMAYAWLSLGGNYGLIQQLFGFAIPRLSGYWGSVLVLSLYTYPYLFLNLRHTLMGIDPKLEEAARGLGSSNQQIFWQVILPQLRSALLAGWVIIAIYVLNDFGAVSLMRYETYSYAIYIQYISSFDRTYAAWLALIAITITGLFLFIDQYFMRRQAHAHAKQANRSSIQLSPLNRWAIPAYSFIALIVVASLMMPLSTIIAWLTQINFWGQLHDVSAAGLNSIKAAIPASLIASSIAILLGFISVYYSSLTAKIIDRVAYVGYATPPIALSLAYIFLSLNLFPQLYQSFSLLIIAYSLHFLALAMGPIRSRYYQIPHHLLETSYSLNHSLFSTFRQITLPLLKKSVFASLALVFVLVMKELPLTFMLAPAGFHTLATNVWSHTNEAMFHEAAPYALIIVVISSLLLSLLLKQEGKHE